MTLKPNYSPHHHFNNSTLLATLLATLPPQGDVLSYDSLFKKVRQIPILYSLEYSGYTPIQFLVEQIFFRYFFREKFPLTEQKMEVLVWFV